MTDREHVCDQTLQAMDQLWDFLNRCDDEIPSPDWHQEVLAERKARAKSGEAKFLTLAELRSHIQALNDEDAAKTSSRTNLLALAANGIIVRQKP